MGMGIPWEWEYYPNLGMGIERKGNVKSIYGHFYLQQNAE